MFYISHPGYLFWSWVNLKSNPAVYWKKTASLLVSHYLDPLLTKNYSHPLEHRIVKTKVQENIINSLNHFLTDKHNLYLDSDSEQNLQDFDPSKYFKRKPNMQDESKFIDFRRGNLHTKGEIGETRKKSIALPTRETRTYAIKKGSKKISVKPDNKVLPIPKNSLARRISHLSRQGQKGNSLWEGEIPSSAMQNDSFGYLAKFGNNDTVVICHKIDHSNSIYRTSDHLIGFWYTFWNQIFK